jgi:hypothetical protein
MVRHLTAIATFSSVTTYNGAAPWVGSSETIGCKFDKNGYPVMNIYNARTYFLQVSGFVNYFEILKYAYSLKQ